jgi:hypothetical protein
LGKVLALDQPIAFKIFSTGAEQTLAFEAAAERML